MPHVHVVVRYLLPTAEAAPGEQPRSEPRIAARPAARRVPEEKERASEREREKERVACSAQLPAPCRGPSPILTSQSPCKPTGGAGAAPR